MQEKTVNHGIGVMSYWHAADCDRESLRKALATIGLDRFLPTVRRPSALLKETVQDWVQENLAATQGSRFMVRPLKGEGVTVVEEVQGQDDNAYSTRFTAKIEDPDAARVVTTPMQNCESDLRLKYRNLQEVVTGPQVTHMLVEIIDSLGGLTLRQNGGLYWLHGDKLATWAAVAQAVEGTTLMGQTSTVYVLKQLMDEQGIRAVHDAAVREVTTECERINEEVLGGGLGKRALEQRQMHIKHLRIKMQALSDMLGGSLVKLEEAMDAADTAVCGAVLLLHAESEKELEAVA
jgi:hypothetical protein